MRGRKPGFVMPEAHRRKISEALSGRKLVLSPLQRENWGKRGRFKGGELHWNWQGGLTEERKTARNSAEYKEWRNEVFKRDAYICQDCGAHGVRLHPHHVKSFAYFPELRYEVSNGKTLCIPCHEKTANYGRPSSGKIKMYESALAKHL